MLVSCNPLQFLRATTFAPSGIESSYIPTHKSFVLASHRSGSGTMATMSLQGRADSRDLSAGPSPQEEESGDGRKRRRLTRRTLSCTECKRRKTKASKLSPICAYHKAYDAISKCSSLGVTPCTSCVRRGRPDDCRWENLPETPQYAIKIHAWFLLYQTYSYGDYLTEAMHSRLKLTRCELKSRNCTGSCMDTLLIIPVKRATAPVDLLRCVHPARSLLSRRLQHTHSIRKTIQLGHLNTLVLLTDSWSIQCRCLKI